MTKRYLITILVLLVTQLPVSADTLVFSYRPHPVQHKVVIPLLQDVYADLGYELKFVEAASPTSLKEVELGIADGDISRFASLIDQYDSVLRVEPELFDFKVVLFCKKDIRCNDMTLDNNRLTIATTLLNWPKLDLRLRGANFLLVEYYKQYFNYIDRERVDAIIFPVIIESDVPHKAKSLKRFDLTSTKAYHSLSDKHRSIVEQVSASLRKRLPKYTQSGPKNNEQ